MAHYMDPMSLSGCTSRDQASASQRVVDKCAMMEDSLWLGVGSRSREIGASFLVHVQRDITRVQICWYACNATLYGKAINRNA